MEPGSRFDPNRYMGQVCSLTLSPCHDSHQCMQAYRARYWKEPYFKALAAIEEVSKKHGLTLAEVALRWISHHSLLRAEHGDAVLIGASSVKHIKEVRCSCSVAEYGMS